jgi:TusA-related sulfurtransferase
MSDRPRTVEIAEMLYGPEYTTVWTNQPPSPGDVSEWLRKQRESWSVRVLDRATTINEVTAWCRSQGLKRLDWDFVPKQKIWFREPEVAMLWDLSCSQKTTENPVKTVDVGPKLQYNIHINSKRIRNECNE